MPVEGVGMAKPKKGGIFGSGLNGWDIAGILGDAFSDRGPLYTQRILGERDNQNNLQLLARQKEADRQTEMQDWQAKEQWKRDNPTPINNDTINDFNFYKGLSPEDRDVYHKMRPQFIPDGFGGGQWATPGSGQPAQTAIKPVGQLKPYQGGPTQPASGNFRPEVSNDGSTVIKSLFPKAKITSGYRGPSHPLSKKNPNSYHAKTRGAIDVAPIPGMTFNQYISSIEAAGYPIIEKRDEVNNPSSHATGPHWHAVVGKKR